MRTTADLAARYTSGLFLPHPSHDEHYNATGGQTALSAPHSLKRGRTILVDVGAERCLLKERRLISALPHYAHEEVNHSMVANYVKVYPPSSIHPLLKDEYYSHYPNCIVYVHDSL
jgi:hypothetical protein